MVTRAAHATPGYTNTLRDKAGGVQPRCAVCHAGGFAQRGTVTTPFGQAMVTRGARPNDEPSVQQAFDALARDGVDSDADGVKDVDELRAGTDPNQPPAAAAEEEGCSASPRRSSGSGGALAAALAAAAAVLLRRFRRSAASSPRR